MRAVKATQNNYGESSAHKKIKGSTAQGNS